MERGDWIMKAEDGSYSEIWTSASPEFPDKVDEKRGRREHPIHDVSAGRFTRYDFNIKDKKEKKTEDVLFHISFAYPPAQLREIHYLSLKNMIKLRDAINNMIDIEKSREAVL